MAPPASAATYAQNVHSLATYYGCGKAVITIKSIPGPTQGQTSLTDGHIYIDTGLTYSRMRYVVAHECAHNKQVRAYKGNWVLLRDDMNRIYGGTGYSGLERNADCATVVWGLTGQHYTTSCSGARRTAALNTIYLRQSH